MTSDERREVAERLRGIDKEWPTLVDDLEEDPLHFGGLAMAGILACIGERAVFRRLADLIDPTCGLIDRSDISGEPMVCSCCGKMLNRNIRWHYCPSCGARVASGNE